MHEVFFYKDRNGREPVRQYMAELAARKDKDSRIKLNKINDYIQALKVYGTILGEPYIKHIEGDIWELRPLRDRILFVAWDNGNFILLHHFMKKTRKTPMSEIEKAKRELADLKGRCNDEA